MKKNILYTLIVALFTCSSCGKFLEEYSQNAAYVVSVNDLEELLYGSCLLPMGKADGLWYLHLVADESREHFASNDPVTSQSGIYFSRAGLHRWMQNPFSNASETSASGDQWDAFYRRISVLNSILLNGEQFWGKEQDAQLSYVLGSSRFLRAWNYLMLVNLYGEPYQKNDPYSGWGVPYKSDPTIEETKFSRNNTGYVYDHIVADLREAVRLMEQGTPPTSKTKVSADACYTLLSRVYLYMEQYDLAVQAASNVKNAHLWNIVNEYAVGRGESFLVTGNPEVIFAQGISSIVDLFPGTGGSRYQGGVYVPNISSTAYVTDRSLEALFDANDARYSAFFTRSYSLGELVCRKLRHSLAYNVTETDPITTDVVPVPASGEQLSETASLRYAEVVLNKAEAEACLGDIPAATATIRTLLAARYTVLPAIPSEQEALISFIREERRKELCFEGHRWFDLRRYAVNSVLPQPTEIVHEYLDLQNTTVSIMGKYTLRPYTDATKGSWIFPVPDAVLDYCFPNITNHDREAGVVKTVY